MRTLAQFATFYTMLLLGTVELSCCVIFFRSYFQRRQRHLLMIALFFLFGGSTNLLEIFGQALQLHNLPSWQNALTPVYPATVLIGAIFYTLGIIEIYAVRRKALLYLLAVSPMILVAIFTPDIQRVVVGVNVPVQTDVLAFLGSPYLGWLVLNIIVAVTTGIVFFKKRARHDATRQPDFLLFLAGSMNVFAILFIATLIAVSADNWAFIVYLLMVSYIPLKALGNLASKHPEASVIEQPTRLLGRRMTYKLMVLMSTFYAISSFVLMFAVSQYFIGRINTGNEQQTSDEMVIARSSVIRELEETNLMVEECLRDITRPQGECGTGKTIYRDANQSAGTATEYSDTTLLQTEDRRIFFTPGDNPSEFKLIKRRDATDSYGRPITIEAERPITLDQLSFCDKIHTLPISGCGLLDADGHLVAHEGEAVTADAAVGIVEQAGDTEAKRVDLPNEPTAQVSSIRFKTLTLYMYTSAEENDQEKLRVLSYVTILTFIFLLLMCLPMYFGITRTLKPLNSLRRSLNLLKSGKKIQPLPLKTSDEIGQLSQELHDMTVAVQERTEQLSETVRQQREFIGLTVHELKTPLNAFRWALETLSEIDESRATPEQKEMMVSLRQSSDRMREMVNGLLNLSRLDRAKIEVNYKDEDLVGLVERVCKELQPLADAKMQELVTFSTDKEAVLPFDPELIHHVLENLVGNAIKYSPDHGKILVRVADSPNGGFLRVSVEDNGMGIPKADQYKMFSPFFRAANAKAGEIEGTGLGLNITKRFVELHGGNVGFVSVENEGSTFWFELPLRPQLTKKTPKT